MTPPVLPKRTTKARGTSYLPFAKCSHKSPCGEPCTLSAAHRHSYHSCGRTNRPCPICHADERFGRKPR